MRNSLITTIALLLMSGCYSARCDCLPGPNVPLPDLSGTYSIHLSLGGNACGDVTVQNAPTAVTHDRVTNVITLTQSGTTWRGAVSRVDTAFTTEQATVTASGFRYVTSIAGRFTGSGFSAVVTTDRMTMATGAQCRYFVHWTALRA